MVPSGRKKILMLHHRQPLLRTYALLLEHRGYEVAAVNSVTQMILRLEAEEDCFDGLLVEVSQELRENPSNFVRFVNETQATSRPAVILSGWGSQEVMFAAREEGIAAVIKPTDTEELLSTLHWRRCSTKDGKILLLISTAHKAGRRLQTRVVCWPAKLTAGHGVQRFRTMEEGNASGNVSNTALGSSRSNFRFIDRRRRDRCRHVVMGKAWLNFLAVACGCRCR